MQTTQVLEFILIAFPVPTALLIGLVLRFLLDTDYED